MNYCGDLRKMQAVLQPDGKASYRLPLGDDGTSVPLDALLGRSLTLAWQGEIHCIHCGRKTSKSFNQGYCFPCVRRLARCDTCIVKPELCHFHQGTCREPEWARRHCFQPHVVYLANASGVKVGITRRSQIPTRWLDQGATQALAILQVPDRRLAGLVEAILRQSVSDRTQWQKMLKGEAEPADLTAWRERLLDEKRSQIEALEKGEAIRPLAAEPLTIRYPVLRYPEKVKAWNFDKTATVTGVLQGIKGQYLILDTGVLNVRKFAGYRVTLTV